MRKSTFVALLVAGALLIPAGVYASHQFTDVPNSNTFHSHIGWMADNDITLGCNPPANTRYCPDDNVTRGQMAAFMRRLSENVVPTLYADGDAGNGGTGLVASGRVTVNSISIDVPHDGSLVVSGNVFINNNSGAARQYASEYPGGWSKCPPPGLGGGNQFRNPDRTSEGQLRLHGDDPDHCGCSHDHAASWALHGNGQLLLQPGSTDGPVLPEFGRVPGAVVSRYIRR